MKLVEFEEKEDYVEYKLDLSKDEEIELNKICEEHNITIEEFINLCLLNFINNREDSFEFIKKNRTDKCITGKIGKPLFKKDDEVGFYIKPYRADNEIFCKGSIYIIDAYGTFEQNIEPSYDIMVQNFNNSGEPCLVKHIRESQLYTLKFSQ